MTTSSVLPWLTGPAAALVVLIWVVVMARQDIRDLRRALEAERRRADSAEEAARASLAVISALTGQPIPAPPRAYAVQGPVDDT
jgi:hypothetical protein